MAMTTLLSRRVIVCRRHNALCTTATNDRRALFHQAKRRLYSRPSSSVAAQHLLPHPHNGLVRNGHISRNVSFSSSSSFTSSSSSSRGGDDSKTVLSQIAKTIQSLQRNLDALPPLPPVWRRNHKNKNNNNNEATMRKRRREILHATHSLVQQIQQLVNQGVLDPTRTHGREMAVILEYILKLYSQCEPDDDDDENKNGNTNSIRIPSVFDECQKVLHLLHHESSYQLQNRRQRGHDMYAMITAANEAKWEQASDLFLACINDEGAAPFDIDIANPVPLYAVAARYQQYHHHHHHSSSDSGASTSASTTTAAVITTTVVENVMDAVHQMTLVSPTDEERYILAAGTALGLAGECKALVQYLERKTNLESSQSQQPLVAATMQACLLSHEPELAMQVFDAFFGNQQALAASEWLWAGGQDCMSPLCRDLAMRALGACAWNQATSSTTTTLQQQHVDNNNNNNDAGAEGHQDANDWSATRALDFYRDAKAQGMTISIQALHGVVLACECDGKWQEAVQLLLSVLSLTTTRNQNSGNAATDAAGASKPWIVRGEELDIQSVLEGEASMPLVQDLQHKLVPILETAMRACNAAGHYGISMLCLRFWSMSLQNEEENQVNSSNKNSSTLLSSSSSMTLFDSLAPLMVVGSRDNESHHDTVAATSTNLLRTTMSSLCGVKCTEDAARLYEAVAALTDNPAIGLDDANDIYEFTQSPECRFAGGLPAAMSSTPSPWEMVDSDMQNLFAILINQAQPKGEAFQGNKQRQQQQQQLLLQSSVAAQSIRHCTNLGQPLAGIYWLAGIHGGNEEISKVSFDIASLVQHLYWNNGGGSSSKLLLTDSLLASVMEAYTAMQEPSLALELFETLIELDQVQPDWVLSRNVVLDALFACNRDQDAIAMFEYSLATSVRNPDTFSIAARWLSIRRDYPKVENIYRLALSTGGACISESLCLQAMKAVSEEHQSADVKLRVLRSILDEVAKLMGMTRPDWIESKYWDLKSHVRFADLRSLLWWHDPRTAFLDELDLAVGVFEKRSQMSLTPKHSALRAIVKVAKDYHDDLVPLNKTQIPRVPRNQRDWNNLMTRVLREAEGTSLLQDPQFVEDAATALRRLGQEDAAAAWRRQVYLGR